MGEELRDESLAGAEIGHRDGRDQAQRELANGLPRAAGAVMFTQPTGDQVKILFRKLPAFLQAAIEIAVVFRGFRQGGD